MPSPAWPRASARVSPATAALVVSHWGCCPRPPRRGGRRRSRCSRPQSRTSPGWPPCAGGIALEVDAEDRVPALLAGIDNRLIETHAHAVGRHVEPANSARARRMKPIAWASRSVRVSKHRNESCQQQPGGPQYVGSWPWLASRDAGSSGKAGRPRGHDPRETKRRPEGRLFACQRVSSAQLWLPWSLSLWPRPIFFAVPAGSSGVRGGRDGLGTGARGRGARARRALMSTTRLMSLLLRNCPFEESPVWRSMRARPRLAAR